MISVQDFFKKLNKETLHLVDEFYHDQCQFQDPVATLNGLSQIKEYYTKLYHQVQCITFEFKQEVHESNRYSGTWLMTLQANGFNGGKPVSVQGISYIEFDLKNGKAIYHRDYFDMGEFVYEWAPIIGPQVRFVKSIFKKNHEPKVN